MYYDWFITLVPTFCPSLTAVNSFLSINWSFTSSSITLRNPALVCGFSRPGLAPPAWLQFQPGPARSKEKNFQLGPSPARMKDWNLGPSPTRPKREIEISARARPDLKRNAKFWPGQFFFLFHPRQLGLSDFKTGPFSYFHIINVFFCCWFFFPQIIKTTELVLNPFS